MFVSRRFLKRTRCPIICQQASDVFLDLSRCEKTQRIGRETSQILMVVLYPSSTSQSVSPFPLTHRRPVLGVFVFRFGCDLKRSTPPLGERVHTLQQPGHSTAETPLCSKRWRAMGTIPENVQLPDVADCNSSFSRDRACVIWFWGRLRWRTVAPRLGELLCPADTSLPGIFLCSPMPGPFRYPALPHQ